MLDITRSQEPLLRRLLEPYQLLWSRREVLLQTVRINLLQRHAGSWLGAAWLILGPLLLIATYGYMFVVVLNIRPPGMTVGQYLAHMCCGLLTYLVMSQALSSAATSLTQDPGLVLNRVFPAELISFREVLTAVPLLIVGLGLSIPWGLSQGTLGWNWLLLPVLLAFALMTLAGCAWILSLCNLLMRDTPQILAYVLMLLMLTSPIAYEASMLPRQAQFLVSLNPFAYFLTAIQDIVVHGRPPSPLMLQGVVITALLAFHGGYALFQKGKIVIAENV